MYDISVHCYFPGTIYSPGFEEEEKCKPAITKKIEGADEGLSPGACAKVLLTGPSSSLVRFRKFVSSRLTPSFLGVERGHFHITNDLIGHLFRNASRGLSPMNSLVDLFWAFIALVSDLPEYPSAYSSC
jgi:3-dehydrosphinganine reductase